MSWIDQLQKWARETLMHIIPKYTSQWESLHMNIFMQTQSRMSSSSYLQSLTCARRNGVLYILKHITSWDDNAVMILIVFIVTSSLFLSLYKTHWKAPRESVTSDRNALFISKTVKYKKALHPKFTIISKYLGCSLCCDERKTWPLPMLIWNV